MAAGHTPVLLALGGHVAGSWKADEERATSQGPQGQLHCGAHGNISLRGGGGVLGSRVLLQVVLGFPHRVSDSLAAVLVFC